MSQISKLNYYQLYKAKVKRFFPVVKITWVLSEVFYQIEGDFKLFAIDNADVLTDDQLKTFLTLNYNVWIVNASRDRTENFEDHFETILGNFMSIILKKFETVIQKSLLRVWKLGGNYFTVWIQQSLLPILPIPSGNIQEFSLKFQEILMNVLVPFKWIYCQEKVERSIDNIVEYINWEETQVIIFFVR